MAPREAVDRLALWKLKLSHYLVRDVLLRPGGSAILKVVLFKGSLG